MPERQLFYPNILFLQKQPINEKFHNNPDHHIATCNIRLQKRKNRNSKREQHKEHSHHILRQLFPCRFPRKLNQKLRFGHNLQLRHTERICRYRAGMKDRKGGNFIFQQPERNPVRPAGQKDDSARPVVNTSASGAHLCGVCHHSQHHVFVQSQYIFNAELTRGSAVEYRDMNIRLMGCNEPLFTAIQPHGGC